MLQRIYMAVKPLSKAKSWYSGLQGTGEEIVFQIWKPKCPKCPEVKTFWPFWDGKNKKLSFISWWHVGYSLQLQSSGCSLRTNGETFSSPLGWQQRGPGDASAIASCHWNASLWRFSQGIQLGPPLLWGSGSRLPGEEDTFVSEGSISLLSLPSESFPFFSWKLTKKQDLAHKGQCWGRHSVSLFCRCNQDYMRHRGGLLLLGLQECLQEWSTLFYS